MGSLSNLYISQSYQSLIHLATNNTASATLIDLQDGLGNSIGVSVNTGGDLYLSGSLTASLQQGYAWVGNSNNITTLVPTSSFGGVLPTGTISSSAQITSLGFVSSSITASSLITASFSGNTLTFTKGDSSTFGVVIPDISGSTINTGSFVTTSSFNSYTSSNDSKVNQLIAATGSYATTGSNTFVGAQNIKNSLVIEDPANPLIYTQLDQNSVNGLFQFYQAGGNGYQFNNNVQINGELTASLQQGYAWVGNSSNVSTLVATSSFGSALPAGTISGSSQITALGFVSSSITASSLVTASVSLNTITFTKGDASTFNITVNTGSAITTDITALNTFTQSQETKDTTLANVTSSLNSATASLFTSTSLSLTTASVNLNTITFTKGDASTFNITVNTGSGGGGGSTDTGSLMVTGSIAGNILTFTKGDASTFSLTIPSATGSVFDTGSFLTTGSLAFGGSTNKGNGLYQFNIATGSAGYAIEIFNTGSDALYGGTGSMRFGITDPGNPFIQLKGQAWFQFGTGNQLQFQSFTSSYDNGIIIGPYYTSSAKVHLMPRSSSLQFSQDIGSGEVPIFTLGTHNGVSQSIFEKDLRVKGQFTASLAQGYAWVGNSSNVSTLVATSSFGGGTTYINPTLNPYSGSLILVANTFTSSSFAHISASANGQVNLVFKNNNNTQDTIISGSSNIFVNPATVTPATTPITFKRYIGGSGNIILNGSNVPQISGSMAFSPTMNNNYFGGNSTVLNMRGPVSSSAWTISSNISLGSISIGSGTTTHAEKLVSGLTMVGNSIQGTLTIVANQSALSSSVSFQNNIVAGTATLNLSSSAVAMSNNIINDSAFTLTNQFYSSSLGLGTVAMNRNNIGGQTNSIIISGSLPVGGAQSNSISDNFIFGGNNTIYIDVANARLSGSAVYKNVIRTGLMGNNLIVSGSSLLADASSYGSVFVGRYNANDNIRNRTSNTVFAVGTGNTTTRKTGFLIDSGSNTYVEGTFNVSGSTSLTGSLTITGSASVNGSQLVTSNQTGSFITSLSAGGIPLELLYNLANGGTGYAYILPPTSLTGSVQITSGSQLTLPTGSNQQAGTAVLDGANPGEVIVSNSLVTANSIIMLTKQTLAHTNGYVAVSAKSAGSFTITSNHNGDADTVGWFIINNS